MVKSLEQELIENEKKRRDALSRQDAQEYALYCTQAGLSSENIEDCELYERGALELESKKVDLQTSDTKKREKYEGFFSEGSRLNGTNFRESYETKRRLLSKHFPGRFGKNGIQPVADYEPERLGALFQKMLDESRIRKTK